MHKFDAVGEEQKKVLDKLPYLKKIEGWLFGVEAAELFEISSRIKSTRPVVCEIGVWKGKSSYVFASAMREIGGMVYSIDPFNGDGDDESKGDYHREMKKLRVTLLENFENTMDKYGLRRYVNILPMTSETARSKFSEPAIDRLFIDGDHEYESVKKDYELWSPLVPPGGTIVLHDVGAVHVDGPKRIMREYIVHSLSWKNARIVGEMGVAQKV